jgi:CubicO group peptidase (beta-lactamase class C family)
VVNSITVLFALLLLFSSAASCGERPAEDSSLAGRQARVKTFLAEELECDRYVFPRGPFPEIHWKRPETVERLTGVMPLTVDFFDHAYARVTRAENTGRYGAVVRGRTPDGFEVVRYITLYCSDVELDDYSPSVPIMMRSIPGFGVSQAQWQSYERSVRKFSFGSLLTFPRQNADAAVFLAGLSEHNPGGEQTDTPRLRDRQWWGEFKRRLYGPKQPGMPLKVQVLAQASPVIQDRSTSPVPPYNSTDIRILREICSAWTDSSGHPMVALVVHRGNIIFHESFGKNADDSRMIRSTPTWMASITKFLTGVLVMQFVDRGLLDLDAPLDRYLPELSSATPCGLTLRHLLTHTSGLAWAGEWASDWNPSMENQVAQALPYVVPGRTFKYHRAGYALTSKVLERISGQTVPFLFDRMILKPLGMDHSYADNTYGGLYAPATDLARFGQMLLGMGRYGHYQILSSKAFHALLPQPLRFGEFDLHKTWGIGCAPLGGNGLSDSTFGHEAASGAVFRVDPVNELVVIVGRNAVGPDERQYKRFVGRFLHAVATPFNRSGSRD